MIDAVSNKKWGSIFFHRKKTKPWGVGGGSEGGLAKDHTLSVFFSCILPLVEDNVLMGIPFMGGVGMISIDFAKP